MKSYIVTFSLGDYKFREQEKEGFIMKYKRMEKIFYYSHRCLSDAMILSMSTEDSTNPKIFIEEEYTIIGDIRIDNKIELCNLILNKLNFRSLK